MIYSMTGFGEASRETDTKTYRIEVRSLNGKNTDIRFRTSLNLRDKELALRKLVTEKGLRGKFDVNLVVDLGGAEDSQLNVPLMEKYYAELKGFSEKHSIPAGDVMQSLIRMPNVVQVSEENISDGDWKVIEDMTTEAMAMLNGFRQTEGKSLYKDLQERVANILKALEEIEQHEPTRIVAIKERIRKNLNQHMNDESVDKNRFEQEILFYMEKLDINEEKVRLTQHCKFFKEALDMEQITKGKKLNFISQEMGREINTLGAKAQHSEIQQLVVTMKDELEKIKEQVLNTL